MKFRYATASEIGPRVANEDAIAIWPITEGQLGVAVADGLGGYSGGQQASDIAIKLFGAAIKSETKPDLQKAALTIHEAIRLQQKQNPEIRGMATTLSGGMIINDRFEFVHSGDTRILLQRNNGIQKLTVDHTEAQRLFDAGAITKSEFVSYPRKNVLDSALGAVDVPRIDIGYHDLKIGDRIFLTTDGVHSKIFQREIRDVSVDTNSPEDAVKKIINMVNSRGSDDNFSVACIFID